MTSRRILKFFAPLLLPAAFLFSGCGNLGTAVVLWPPEESVWNPGDLVTVKDDSFLRKTYIVNLPDQRQLKEEVDQWRLKLFRREKEAAAWSAGMGEWTDVYAECLYQGLPMRSEPSNTASRVYRFRDGDVMKVLGRDPGPVQVGNLEGFWYYVLADGGVEGYVFDYHLRVMRVVDGTKEILNARNNEDPVLENLISGPWRPKYFDDMIANRNIDLGTFRSEFGLFPDVEHKKLILNLPDRSFSETWTDIVPAGRDRYDFLGTSFRITVNSENFISVQYNHEGADHFEAFVRLSRDIAAIIEDERTRRETVLENLITAGPVYGSRAYGELAILEDGGFTWTGKSSLISRGIITSSAGNTGRLEFDCFPSPDIAAFYEGVLSLRFDNGEKIRFLYSFEDGGLRLLFVPKNAIEDKTVRSDQFFDPVRLFFVSLAPASSDDGVLLPDR